MTEERKRVPNNMLTAEELLRNKSIRSVAWDEFERSVNILPKTGKKQFEPNNSWLQNMQIEKGIENRKYLLGIERVDRISQLAIAEWLPTQKRAKVKKFSGQDWANFGLEKNGALYLIPEEALFLLEANSLELTWNDMSLSVQQAYDLLIDNVECSIEEYRVYSQLVRYGYRIQRFIYEQPERSMRSDETTGAKRKVIVDPENGLRMADTQQSQGSMDVSSKTSSTNDTKKPNTNCNDPDIEICPDPTVLTEHPVVEDDVHRVIEDLLCTIENQDTQYTNTICENHSEESSVNLDTESHRASKNNNKEKRNHKVEIISEEMLVGNIKIVRDTADNSVNHSSPKKWQGSRIQRNVKLLPKRTDKPTVDISATESHSAVHEQCVEKRKGSNVNGEELQAKKPRHEVIELSDDEIQEVPRPMTRMELLNLIPNIASQGTTTAKISRGYIPHNIKPHQNVYRYDNAKLRNLQEADKKLRSNTECTNNNVRRNTSHFNHNSNNEVVRRNANFPAVHRNLSGNVQDVFMREFYHMDGGQCMNYVPPFMYNNRFSFAYNHNPYWHNRNAIVQRNLFQNVFIALENHGNAIHHNRFLSIQMNNFSIPNTSNSIARNPFIRNQFRHSFHQNFSPQRRFYQHRVVENTIHCNVGKNGPHPEQRHRITSRESMEDSNKSSNYGKHMYQPSFKVLPGASSWTELKSKWREEKTITIDDEDSENREDSADCNEIQVVETFSNPLIGPRNVKNLAEVFERLRIIKPAPEKTVRRNKSKHKISYNVYSSTLHYRKATPGPPLYRVVVIKQKDDPYIQPIEIHRLHQDAKNSPIVLACVSMSISYIQPGFISVPDLT